MYEKTVNFGALPNGTTRNVAHGISNINNIVSIDAIAIKSGAFKPIPYIWNTAHVDIEATDAYIYINTSGDYSSYTGYVTLRYTKTA